MLKVENLQVAYGEVLSLQSVSFEVRKGEIVALLGANGAGKSTTLKAISGLLKVKLGSVYLDSQDITSMTPEAIFRKGLVHVPEGRRVFPGLTVVDNLLLGGACRAISPNRRELKRDLEMVLDIFPGLRKVLHRPGWTLSGGEQQMLAIGRGLMGQPKLLTLDEPSLGLAPIVVRELFSCIKKINQQGITILLVEQNAHMALEISKRIYVLQLGTMVYESSSENAKKDSKLIESYLGTDTSRSA